MERSKIRVCESTWNKDSVFGVIGIQVAGDARSAKAGSDLSGLNPSFESGKIQRGLAHLIKDAHADGRRLRHLNGRAGGAPH
jgi:hypothetical protein